MTSVTDILQRLGMAEELAALHSGDRAISGTESELSARSPIDGALLARFPLASAEQVPEVVRAANEAFQRFRMLPAPARGNVVRALGESLREHQEDLAKLVSIEVGKIRAESLGEVQEMIDICDFATGLSRQLHGLTIASERRNHRLTEQWHPLGPVAVITAFNFPVAVWAWNAALALVCGDPVIWKPSEKAPLSALAVHAIATGVLREFPEVPKEILSLLIGGPAVGHALVASPQVPLVSATGSVRMGQSVGRTVAERLGRSLLELGGNNALVVAPSANTELAIRSIVFAAAGTAGQRCTSLRRLILHESVADDMLNRLARVYAHLRIGDPLQEGTVVGPLIDEVAWHSMSRALEAARAQGGRVVTGGDRLTEGVPTGGVYVRPAIVEIPADAPIVQEETFAPLLYVHRYGAIEQAIEMNNSVPQGLSSAIFTTDVREAELFCSASGSDCGIVNVNTGTSGAEIGGAFGGEKQTGGGRESGSDAWKAYMRRSTNTVNYGADLPLAQGIRFGV